MKSTDAEAGDAGQKNPARRDIVLVVAVAVIAAFVCVKLNVSEVLLNRTRPFEQLQLDEVPGVLLVIAVSLIWFSLRRYFEANRQLRLRRTVEVRLEEALAENQRLASNTSICTNANAKRSPATCTMSWVNT
jgi:two-component system sensor histidine kinase UhpB